MNVSDVISRARTLLNDTDATGYRWSQQDLIDYINDAQRMIAVLRPDSSSGTTVATLVAGTKQTIPSGGFRILDIPRNIGSDGSTPGRAIRIVDRDVLDQFEPGWHSATKKSEVKHYTYDERFPLEYFVYPPVNAGVKIEVRFGKFPTVLTATGDALSISDAYFEVILNYVMYRCYLKDAEFSGNAALAAQYLQAASGLLGVKIGKDNAFSPKTNRQGGDPNVAAAQMGGVV